MAVRPIDALELRKRMCAICNQDYADEPCERSDCIFIRALSETPTLTQPNEPLVTGFNVVDTKTGEYPELEKIALKEDWAKHLMYCDMEGFAIEEDGTLLLLDECGRQACCPAGRFEIRHLQEGDDESGAD